MRKLRPNLSRIGGRQRTNCPLTLCSDQLARTDCAARNVNWTLTGHKVYTKAFLPC